MHPTKHYNVHGSDYLCIRKELATSTFLLLLANQLMTALWSVLTFLATNRIIHCSCKCSIRYHVLSHVTHEGTPIYLCIMFKMQAHKVICQLLIVFLIVISFVTMMMTYICSFVPLY